MRLSFALTPILVASITAGQATHPSPSPQCCTAVIRIHVPDGTGPVYLAGSLAELGPWRPDGRVTEGTGPERSVHRCPGRHDVRTSSRSVEELMPRVNATFHTLTGPKNTTVMGSSMGGLLSYYLVAHHPEVFGACGCLSTAFTLSESMVARYFSGVTASATPDTTPYIVRDIAAGFTVPKGTRYWFDYGALGIDSTFGPSHEVVKQWLLRQHLVEGRDFVIRRYDGANHNEASWRARLEDPLIFLFGKH